MARIYLIVAGLFEIGWPVGLKLSQTPGRLLLGASVAVACMAASGALRLVSVGLIVAGIVGLKLAHGAG